MARLQNAIQNIVAVFMENADCDGKLKKDELKKIMEKEFDCPELKASLPSMDFDKVLERSDRDKDGEISFKEFAKCMAFLANGCYCKKTGKDTGCGMKGQGCRK